MLLFHETHCNPSWGIEDEVIYRSSILKYLKGIELEPAIYFFEQANLKPRDRSSKDCCVAVVCNLREVRINDTNKIVYDII